jgi:hypothetical protein
MISIQVGTNSEGVCLHTLAARYSDNIEGVSAKGSFRLSCIIVESALGSYVRGGAGQLEIESHQLELTQ